MWKFGLQMKSGDRQRFEIESGMSVMILKCKIFELTNIPPEKQILRTGRPPKPIQVVSDDMRIKDVGSQLQNMDLIIVEEEESLDIPPRTKVARLDASLLPPTQHAPAEEKSTINFNVIDCGIEPQPTMLMPKDVASRVVIPGDNSCLFASILHCLKPILFKHNKRLTSKDLRKICSDRVKNEVNGVDSSTLMDSIIAESDGKLATAEEYSRRILNPSSWGGEVECKILSEYFQVQIVAGNIELARFNKYPIDNKRYKARIYILYDGIHYDACEKGKGFSIFHCDDICEVYNEVSMVLLQLKERKQYTNTGTFCIVCQDCWKEMYGEKELQAHAKQTGHFNFQERK